MKKKTTVKKKRTKLHWTEVLIRAIRPCYTGRDNIRGFSNWESLHDLWKHGPIEGYDISRLRLLRFLGMYLHKFKRLNNLLSGEFDTTEQFLKDHVKPPTIEEIRKYGELRRKWEKRHG